MNNDEYVFDDSLFTYVISDEAIGFFSKQVTFNVANKNIIINLTRNTDCFYAVKDSLKVGIIGFCVDGIKRAERSEIAQIIVDNCNNINEVIEFSRYFAGKYAIIVEDLNGVFIFTDPTAQLGVYYDTTKFMISSNEYLIGKLNNYSISESAKNIIKKRTDLFQPFPYDVTHFDNVKYLIPNHYLNIDTSEAKRIKLLYSEEEKSYTQEEIVDKSFEIINNIVTEYVKYYPEIICDLTSGYDSRLNFGFLLNNKVNFKTMTMKYSNSINDIDDVNIAEDISNTFSIKHEVLEPVVVTDEIYNEVAMVYGDYFEKQALFSAYNMLANYGKNSVFVDGNIVNLCKSFLNRGLPDKYATVLYLRAKQHNFSKETKVNVKKHLKDIKSENNSGNIFDLYTIETRSSRWATNYSIWADVLGIVKLNIYNCRYWLELIMRLPYNYRAKNNLQIGYYKKLANGLLDFPINPHQKKSFILRHPHAFLFATYAKFYLTKMKGKY